MGLSWIEHKGTKILHIDASNLGSDFAQLKTVLDSLTATLNKQSKDSVLGLADLRNTMLNNSILITLMSNAPLAAPYFRKSALVIEPNRARRILLDSFGQFVGKLPRRFESLEEAKNWLVSDEM
jgi:hypothetical protein